MNRFRASGVWVALVWLTAAVGCAPVAEDGEKPNKTETVVIPLDQIWANDMPGTQSIKSLEGDLSPGHLLEHSPEEYKEVASNPLWKHIAVSLMSEAEGWPSEGQTARPGFAVLGTGKDAFRNAYKVLVGGVQPQQAFVVGDKISLVFFSYGMGAHIHIQSVKKSENEFEVAYRFVLPIDMTRSVHVALIPVADLHVGDYAIQLKMMPPANELEDGTSEIIKDGVWHSSANDWAKRFVCQPYSFRICEAE